MSNRASRDPQEYMNLISLLERALMFYANDENHKQNLPINDELCSYVELDRGQQAKFALEQIKEFDIRYDDAIPLENFNLNVDSVNKEELEKTIEKIKKEWKL